jgi:phosphosulfolactate synthase
MGLLQIEDQLRVCGSFVDLVKIGWGTSIVLPDLDQRLQLFEKYDVEVCFGGTMFELFFLQGKIDEYLAFLKDVGITVLEISDGTLAIEEREKLRLIETFAKHFKVLSEVGSKDSQAIVSPARWVRAIQNELRAGADSVILEGRESGTAGLYRGSGEVRMGLIDEIIEAGISIGSLIFEAPQKHQQTWLIEHCGPDVNLGNIALPEVVAVETLRLGLRSDTLLFLHSHKGA